MTTTGRVLEAIPPVEFEGLVLKASFVAEPAAMVRLTLAAAVSPVEVAVRV